MTRTTVRVGLCALLIASPVAVLPACGAATNPAPVVVSTVTLGECIVQQALAGQSVVQIADACKTDLATVLVEVLADKNAQTLAKTPALAEAKRARQAMMPGVYDAGPAIVDAHAEGH